jgi:hypothetical protein
MGVTEFVDAAPPVHRHRRDDPYAGEVDDLEDADEDLCKNRELPSFIPPRLRAAIDNHHQSWTPVDSFAMAIIGVQLFILFVETVGGSLYLDDLRAQAYALNQPFWSFIMDSNGTHFAPLPRVLDWIQSRTFPLEHGPAMIITLVVRLLLALVFWRLLRRLFGPRMLTLLPLTILVITPAMLPATLWYRQSITIVACTVCMLWALEAHLRWLLRSTWGALAEVGMTTALGLGCYEKAAAIPVILTGTTIAVFAPGMRGTRRMGTPEIRRQTLISVLLSAIVVGIFLVIYRSGPYDQGSAGMPSVMDVLHLAWDTATRNIIPLLLGGPYHWDFSAVYAGTAHLSSMAVAIVMLITGIGILITALRKPSQLARGFMLLLAWALPSVAIVALGRYASFQLALADATRLWADLAPAFILATALALLPWQIGACRPGRSVRRGPVRGHPWTIPAVALGFAVIAIGSGVSTVSYLAKWWDNPTGDWITNMRTSVSQAEPFARVIATPLPEAVMPLWVSSQLPTSAPLLQLIRSDLRFNDGDGVARAINSAGQLAPFLQGQISSTAPAKLCAKAIPIGKRAYTGVRLTAPAPYVAGAQAEVGVLLDEVTPVRVQVLTLEGERITPQTFSTQPLSAGAHVLHYPVPLGKTLTGVYVQTNATRTGCIVNARVWAPLMGPPA